MLPPDTSAPRARMPRMTNRECASWIAQRLPVLLPRETEETYTRALTREGAVRTACWSSPMTASTRPLSTGAA